MSFGFQGQLDQTRGEWRWFGRPDLGTGIFVVPGEFEGIRRVQALPHLTYDLTRAIGQQVQSYKWVPESVAPYQTVLRLRHDCGGECPDGYCENFACMCDNGKCVPIT